MGSNYYERGDRLNVYLAAELPEGMTGTQDTQHICGKCAWYSFRKLESTCGKTGMEVAYFANKECFTTTKEQDMEEEIKEQTKVCKECGRELPLENYQRRRNGALDSVCKECRAEQARIGKARRKAENGQAEAKAPLDAVARDKEAEVAALSNTLMEMTVAGFALNDFMPERQEDIDKMVEAVWDNQLLHDIFKACAVMRAKGRTPIVPALAVKEMGATGDLASFINALGHAFHEAVKEATCGLKGAAATLDACTDGDLFAELRKRGYAGMLQRVQNVEV